MAEGVNLVVLLGNLGTAPELRETSYGKSVCNFRMATNVSVGKGGSRKDKKVWHRIAAWGVLGEMCAEFLKKGSCVHIVGHLQNTRIEDLNGGERYITEVVADKMSFLDNKREAKELDKDG